MEDVPAGNNKQTKEQKTVGQQLLDQIFTLNKESDNWD